MPPPYPGINQPRGSGDGKLPGSGEPVVKLYKPPPPRYVPTRAPLPPPVYRPVPVFDIAGSSPLGGFNPPAHVPVIVPDPFLSRPVPIFDITGRTTNRILQSIPAPPPVRILSPEEIQHQQRKQRKAEERREDEQFRQLKIEQNVRGEYNELHGKIDALKQKTLGAGCPDITGTQMNLLDTCARNMSANSFAMLGHYSGSFANAQRNLFAGCEAWIQIVNSRLNDWCPSCFYLNDSEEIAEQLSTTCRKVTNLYGRNKLKLALDALIVEWKEYWKIFANFTGAALACDNSPGSLNRLRGAAAPVAGLCLKLKKLHASFEELGEDFETAMPRVRIAPENKRTPQEQAVVTAWNVVYTNGESPFTDSQAEKMISTGDFEMLKQFTSIIRFIKANRNVSPLRYGGVDLNVHALSGQKVTSFDFPFLNKNRLGSTNRGIWRIMFQGQKLYGIFNDHDGLLVKWTGTGLMKTNA